MKVQTIRNITYKKILLVIAMFLSVFITTNAFAASVDLFSKLGYRFTKASTVGQKVYVTYNTLNTSSMTTLLAVYPGNTQFLSVEIPPGTISASVGTEAKSWSGTASAVATATSPGEFADASSVTLSGNTPTLGVLYDGPVTTAGAATHGVMVLQASSTTATAYTAIYLTYQLADSQAALDAFNAWVDANGGTTTYVPPPTTTYVPPPTTTTTDSTDSYFGDGGDAVTTSTNTTTVDNPLAALFGGISQTNDEPVIAEEPPEESGTADEFELQTNKEGISAVLEFLLLQALKDAGVDLDKIDGLVVNADSFEIPGANNGAVLKFALDMTKIPDTIDGISGVSFTAQPLKGMEASTDLELRFNSDTGQVIVPLLPFIYEENALLKSLEGLDGVFKVVTDNGWMLVFMADGTAVSVYFSSDIQAINANKSSGTALDFGNPVDYGYDSNDVNGDGVPDFMVIHDGRAQLMLVRGNTG